MKNLIPLYQKRLNLQNATFTRIDHDDAMVAVVYKITSSTNTPLILKICPRPKNYLREAYFLRHFADKLPVPGLIDVIEPTEELPGAVLIEYLPGKLMSEVTLTKQLAHKAGSLLAKIHLNRVSGYGDIIELNKLNADPRIHFTHKFNEGFDECRDQLPSALLEQCQHYYNNHVDLLVTSDGPCMIHRDFRPGNIIVENDNIQGIIDWASGRAGFAEEDFVWYGWPENNSLKQAFLDGYASIRKLPDFEAIMPLLRLSRAIAVLGFLIRENTWATKNAGMFEDNLRFIEDFFKEKI